MRAWAVVRGHVAQHTHSSTPAKDAIVGEPYDTKNSMCVCTYAALRGGVQGANGRGEFIRLLAEHGLPGEDYVATARKPVSK